MDIATAFKPPDITPTRGAYASTLAVLNRQSVQKHYDAYADIDWQAPEHRIDPEDPVWELQPSEMLWSTSWYQNLPVLQKRQLGLDLICSFMRVGSQFENTLVRGLLEFAHAFPDAAPERRYAMHEAIEECQHIQIFREFIARSGLEVQGLPERLRSLGRFVINLARTRPALFWVFVMGGEDPIDYVQRRVLHDERPLHPLLRKIIQIHVTEEARHLCFARLFIQEEIKSWGTARRHAFGLAAAPILSHMSTLMLYPTAPFIARHRIPPEVLKEAYGGQRHAEQRLGAVGKIRDHFRECGLLTADVEYVWRRHGLA
jgi:hypothetical protein